MLAEDVLRLILKENGGETHLMISPSSPEASIICLGVLDFSEEDLANFSLGASQMGYQVESRKS